MCILAKINANTLHVCVHTQSMCTHRERGTQRQTRNDRLNRWDITKTWHNHYIGEIVITLTTHASAQSMTGTNQIPITIAISYKTIIQLAPCQPACQLVSYCIFYDFMYREMTFCNIGLYFHNLFITCVIILSVLFLSYY